MEHEKGNIPIYSQSIVQSRIFRAKVELRRLIKEYERKKKGEGQVIDREPDEDESSGVEISDDTSELRGD